MDCEHLNHGIATPKVEILESLPYVADVKHVNSFDISAEAFNSVSNSKNSFMDPILVEYITNIDNTFSACFPSRRKYYSDNLLSSSSSSESSSKSSPKIKWTPISVPTKVDQSNYTYFLQHVIKTLPSYYDDVSTDNPISRQPRNNKIDSYIGPIWRNTNYNEEARPDDSAIINKFREFLEGIPPAASPPEDSGSEDSGSEDSGSESPKTFDSPLIQQKDSKKIPVVSRSSVLQTESRDGLWWGIESNAFITEEDMPFGITIEVPTEPPPDYEHPTIFSIHFGSNKNEFELFIKLGTKPQLIDYYGVSNGTIGDDNKVEMGSDISLQSGEFGVGKSEFKGRIDISFMTCAGRLIVFVNNNYHIYTRTEKDPAKKDDIGEIKNIKINKGGVKLYGTNQIANIYAYPLSFSRQGFICFPNIQVTSAYNEDIVYSAVGNDGNPTGDPVCVLPAADSISEKIYGVDCEVFYDSSPKGKISIPKSPGLHAKIGTTIEFFNFKKFFSRSNIKNKYELTDYFMLTMSSSNTEGWLGGSVENGRAPYFFKIRGINLTQPKLKEHNTIDITNDIISLSEKSSASGIESINKSVSFRLYNKDGKYNYLGDKQYGVRISWGWNNKNITTFTGIILDVGSNDTPGSEELNINCEDYMHILENVPIINSPIYDGMLALGAIKDLLTRAGIEEIIVSSKWKNQKAYFLPSGYSFTSPRHRFPSKNMIKECIMELMKRFQGYIYFDPTGRAVIEVLPGGLRGYNNTAELKKDIGNNKFTSLPQDGSTSAIPLTILGQKSVNIDYKDTYNCISILTLDRDTRAPIFHTKSPPGESSSNRGGLGVLSFRKVVLYDEPALGSADAAKEQANRMAKNIFYPIKKTSFKVVNSEAIITPLSYISLDGNPYRLISVNRSYDANSNSMTCDYEAEWLFGKYEDPIL